MGRGFLRGRRVVEDQVPTLDHTGPDLAFLMIRLRQAEVTSTDEDNT